MTPYGDAYLGMKPINGFVTPSEPFRGPLTKEYAPHYYFWGLHHSTIRQRPPFTLASIWEMLLDARVLLGLSSIKGPIIHQVQFVVESSANPAIVKFIQTQLDRFWKLGGASLALKAVEWGWSGSEVVYSRNAEGLAQYDHLNSILPPDCRPVVKNGILKGMRVRSLTDPLSQDPTGASGFDYPNFPTYVGAPKVLWHVHWRQWHRWFGRSRLHGSHPAWWEKWIDGGFRDIRRLWFQKNAFDGGVMYHPTTPVEAGDGTRRLRPAQEVAREILEKKKAGGTITLPYAPPESMHRWEYEPPSAPGVPMGVAEYGQSLDDEILEGMCIPPEVVHAGETAGAFAGRRIPQQGFYYSLNEDARWLLMDFRDQVLDFLLAYNFGEIPDYTIHLTGLVDPNSNPLQEPHDESTEFQSAEAPGGPSGDPSGPGLRKGE